MAPRTRFSRAMVDGGVETVPPRRTPAPAPAPAVTPAPTTAPTVDSVQAMIDKLNQDIFNLYSNVGESAGRTAASLSQRATRTGNARAVRAAATATRVQADALSGAIAAQQRIAEAAERGRTQADNNFITPDSSGGGSTGVISTGGKAPSLEVFRNIISLALGARANEPWIGALYNVAKRYLDDGTLSANDPMLPDILLNDQNAPQEFKDRFRGIFALRDKGARFIPSVADYIKAERDFGNLFRNAGLQDLDNSNFFAQIVENEVDYATASNLINNVYQTINMADESLKRELKTFFPTLQPNDLAKSLLLGKQGEEELALKINQAAITSEATVRGITARLNTADLARRGVTRGQAAEGFENIAQELQPLTRLSQIYERQQAATPETIQTELEQEQFLGQTSRRRRRLAEQEIAAFAGSAGTTPTLASRARAGQF